jgi:protein-tyrosine phosphatase
MVKPGLHISGQHRRHGLPLLQKRGIVAVVNMRVEFDDMEAGIAPELYLHVKTIDNTPPTLDQLREGAEFIQKVLANGAGVYIHCAAGVGRAPTMAAAYLVLTGSTPEEAWSAIRHVRPFICPTRGQIARIEEFARSLAIAEVSKEPELLRNQTIPNA